LKYLLFLTLVVTIFTLSNCSKDSFEKLPITQNFHSLSTEIDLTDSIHCYSIDSLFDTGLSGAFIGADSISIYYKYYLQDSAEKGAIVISSGRTEATVKYKEVIYDLFKSGYSIYIHDHRGQGFSGRMVASHDMGYVDKFENYVADFKQFYDGYIKPNNHKNLFLLSHSLGGAIAILYLEKYSEDFDKAILISPMFGLQFPICELAKLLTPRAPKYALGQGDFNAWFADYKNNVLTSCEIRYSRFANAYSKYSDVKLGGATYQWIDRSCSQFPAIFSNLDKINIPILLFSGENEKVVSKDAHQKFIKKLNLLDKNEECYTVKNSMHEMLFEKDSVRVSVLNKVFDFYSK